MNECSMGRTGREFASGYIRAVYSVALFLGKLHDVLVGLHQVQASSISSGDTFHVFPTCSTTAVQQGTEAQSAVVSRHASQAVLGPGVFRTDATRHVPTATTLSVKAYTWHVKCLTDNI
jgi:hypothetical protein